MEENDLKRICTIQITLQSLIHQIDELSVTPVYVRDIKQRTNNYLNFIEKYVDMFSNTNTMVIDEAESYNQVVKKLDDFLNKLHEEVEVT